MMDYAKTASLVIKYVGGKDNIKSVTHCATRLRFQLRDNGLRNEEAISDLEGVKGVFLTQSQFQIIFGSGIVNMVCDEVQKQLGTSWEHLEEKPEEKEEGKGNVVQRFIKMLSDIFVPIIPAIVAGGLLMGLNNLLTSPLINGRSIIALYPMWQGLASAINTFANAPFTFLPVLIGFSATRKFEGNAFLGAAMGMIMVHPDLLNAYQIGLAQPPVWDIFGFQIAAIGYQGTVLPVLAVSWILANIEKRLRKVTPSWLDNLTTPLLSILVTSFLTFIFVGPVLREVGNLLAAGITWLYNTLGPVGGALFGFAYAPITMTGMHHSFIAIETQLLADSAHTGGSFIFSTASMNNVAQGAAVLAVLLMTKNDKMKSICSASGISALLGITEPAMFGVTLKLKYPFYAAMAGSAAGSAYLAAAKTLAQALGAAGLPGFISMKPDHYMNFAIGIILSMGVSFALTMVFWKRFALDQQDRSEKRTGSRAGEIEEASEMEMPREIVTQLYVPMKGQILDVGQSADEVFASKALGSGVAINPAEGMVCAPCDGTISLLFPTKHAVGITSETGVEVLIHIGINTVQLDGQGFEAFVSQGDKVKKGDKLIAADLDLIREKGMNPQTMMILPEGGNLDVTVYPGEQADAKNVAVKAVKTE
ncbi:PTS beta-glucoside transporter subunit EIIBCA [Enterocloster clostridioformis]|uniref:sucrose-specific PTS transporter subunit IIBC n=1 Tax=Enterocloster clostridioformis TaxID=1531 RepID=UPI0009C2220F|nr:sucrose-specific PTS transporter subunit IIBC [Enterocloster clostridioformis]ANU50336.2 PTS beta-glucoside transporter subunit EIIBCA [Lachnoclostridium sp. YL32]NDO27473.1 PTS beta-glucoside transporter subunit IIBCA [Enterocloster clostridioformis]OXE69938.1 PTS beta-glucoside transporter subunit EIIBCA [Enterocloster clostridioformis]QQR00083.1 PTS transporter subunit EIIC [Enterocloster clostridioformis]